MKPLSLRSKSLTTALLAVGLSLVLAACGRHATRPASELSEKDRTTLDKYETIRGALVVDDLRAAKRAATDLGKFLKPSPDSPATPLDGAVQEILDAPMLDKARDGFKTLSASMIKLSDGVEGYYVAESPVPEGAVWVQRSPKIDNPYVGKPMRDVGSLRK